MKLKIAQVIGLNTDQKAAQVTSLVQDLDNAFFAVLILSCDDAFTKGRQALSELADHYFEFEGSSAEKLTETFKEAEKKFVGSDFDLLLSSVSGKVLYLIGKGQIESYLKRNDKLSQLLSVGIAAQLISGFLQEEDRLLLATKSLLSFLGDDLHKSLNLPIETFENEVSDRIGSQDLEDQGLAGLLLEVEAKVEDIPSLPVQIKEETPIYEYKLSLLKTILSKFKSFLVKLKSFFPGSNKGRLFLGVILILIIAMGVGYKYKHTKDQQRKALFNQTLQGAKDDLGSAKGLATLNPAEAKNKLDSAKDKINKAIAMDSKNVDAANLKKQIEQDSSAILQQSQASDFPIFLDMDLVKKNFRALQMSLSSGKLLLLDPAVKTLVVIDLSKKSNQILAGSETLGDANVSSINGGLAFVYSKDKGVLRIDTTNQKITTVAKKDSNSGAIADIYGFGGNIYMLDKEKNQIWKYLATSEGYSDKREYLAKGANADFSDALRMQIESSIYVLKSGGQILRFTKGDKDNFGLAGLPTSVKNPKSIFVSSDTDNLYLLDSGNSRLLILTKIGGYKGEITGEKFGTASDLVVDEKGKKVYLLDGSKIYSVDLK